MTIAVLANNTQSEELNAIAKGQKWLITFEEQSFFAITHADLYVNLLENASEKNYAAITKPVLINSVTHTLKEMNAAGNILRINGWNGFLVDPHWEVAGQVNATVQQFFSQIKKVPAVVADEPGLISARIIAMIINEAYFALEEKISTKEEIDIAMKQGTNYPYGPFEWSAKIGVNKIYNLLQRLSSIDKRYLPAALLQQEAKK